MFNFYKKYLKILFAKVSTTLLNMPNFTIK